jgi:hypothetical protein
MQRCYFDLRSIYVVSFGDNMAVEYGDGVLNGYRAIL